jgi:sugar-specific transcriptional regulator TrmB
MLGALGIGAEEEDLYRSLVTLGGTSLADLARRFRLEEGDTERLLLSLQQRGLVAQSASRAGRWVAAPPTVALAGLINDRRHELEQAEAAAASLAELHRADSAGDFEDVVEVVMGPVAVAQRFQQVQLGAVEEVCALVTGTPAVVSGSDNIAEDVAASRGVRYRVVIERDALIGEQAQAEVTASLGREEEVRVVERVPTKLIVADRRTAMVPLSRPGDEPGALVLRSAGLVDALCALFELVWRDAWPLTLGSPVGDGAQGLVESEPGPDDLDRQLLALLLTGASDARVAKHLDIGLRTVQRRVRALMDVVGVSTRIQLGWAARERGWLIRD